MGETNFAERVFSETAAQSDSCKERVACSDQIQEQKDDTMAAKTGMPQTCNFDVKFFPSMPAGASEAY